MPATPQRIIGSLTRTLKEFNERAIYKINVWESIVFVYTNSNQQKIWWYAITIARDKIKYLMNELNQKNV